MTVPGLLDELRRRDVQVWVDGDRLRLNAPAGVLTPELRDQLQRRKSDILEFLRAAETLRQQPRAIVPLQPQGSQTPIFGVGGHNGDVFCYRALALHLGDDQPFYGLQPPGLDGRDPPITRIEDLAAYFAAQIRAVRPDRPLVIAGYCAGGAIAFELARQLVESGVPVRFVALFGAPYPPIYRRLPLFRERARQSVVRHARALAERPLWKWPAYIAGRVKAVQAVRAKRRVEQDPVLIQRAQVERATFAAARRYTPGPFDGRVGLFLPSREWARSYDQPLRWRSVAPDAEVYFGPDDCDSDNMLREPYAAAFAELFRQAEARHGAAWTPEPFKRLA